MKIVETTAKRDPGILPEANFADAWRIEGLPAGTSAEQIVTSIFARKPRWIGALMALRNLIVAPLGLIRANPDHKAEAQGIEFPVFSSRPERVVMGLDDKHLDFRLVIDMQSNGRDAVTAVATTYVRTHNALGRTYLAVVKPFHRIIVPAMLKRAVPA